MQWPAKLTEQDDPIAAPRPASPKRGHITQRLWRTTTDSDLLEPAVSEECDGLAVRGPKRLVSALGSRKLVSRHGIQRAKPQNPCAILPIAGRNDVLTVGRHHRKIEWVQ